MNQQSGIDPEVKEAEEYRVLDIESQFEDGVKGYERIIQRMESTLNYLPTVKPDGTSESPMAEHLYAQKEEQEEALEKTVKDILREMFVIEKTIQRYKRNMDNINSHKVRIHSGNVRESYDQAETEQYIQYRKVLNQREVYKPLIARLQAVLAKSRTKKWPGKKPQKQMPFPKQDTQAQAPVSPPAAEMPLPPPAPTLCPGVRTVPPSVSPHPEHAHRFGPPLDGLLEMGPWGTEGPI